MTKFNAIINKFNKFYKNKYNPFTTYGPKVKIHEKLTISFFQECKWFHFSLKFIFIFYNFGF